MLRPIATGFDFPTGVVTDETGAIYVAESGLPFGGAKPGGRVFRVASDGRHVCLLDKLRPPVNGLTYHDGYLYICEGGFPGRISRLSLAGEWQIILDGLPGRGNYHTNTAVIGPDNKLYFSQGAMTNSGIVGLDAYDLGWLKQLPHPHDIPGYDVKLVGLNVETAGLNGDRACTGAFSPFGVETTPGQNVPAGLPCTAAVMRCDLDGSGLELVAWGLRNAYGLGFLPDGRLLATDQAPDQRGSRPVGYAPDLLFEVQPGRWYGWPDFVGGIPIHDERFCPDAGPAPQFILSNHDELPVPERPLLSFPVNAAAVKFDVIPDGSLLVALFGDERPMTAPTGGKVGRKLARVDPADWSLQILDLDVWHRPIDVCCVGNDVYILDFGDFEVNADKNVVAQAGTGTVWHATLDDLL